MNLVLLRDGRETKHVPLFLLQHMPDQVILMQALHDKNDGARYLIIEAADKRVIVPIVNGIPARERQRLARHRERRQRRA